MFVAPSPKNATLDRTGLELLRAERRAGREGEVRADDRERAERADREVGEVHRAALPPAEALLLAEDLRHRPVERSAHREHGAVTTVGARHRVPFAQRGARSDGHRFLSLAEMGAAANEVQHEEAHHLVFEEADLEHPPLEVEEQPALRQRDGAYRLLPLSVLII